MSSTTEANPQASTAARALIPPEEETKVKGKREAARRRNRLSSLEEARFPQMLLNLGFCFALLLSAGCLILSAYYLFSFLNSTNEGLTNLVAGTYGKLDPATLRVAITGRLAMARFALTSCGMFIGIAFGFLGFALFLLGIRKDVDASAEYEDFQARFVRLSPRLPVIICATVLIGVCVTRTIDFGYRSSAGRAAPADSEQESTTQTPAPAPSSEPEVDNDPNP